MKKYFLALSLLLFVLLPAPSQAATLADRLAGRILLQVQAHGEAWYVNPLNLQRYFMGRPADAFNLMRSFGLGISNRDFNSFNGVAPSRLSGRILLKVEDLGRAYYVNPVDLRMHYLGRPDDAFRIMRSLGLGITSSDIASIPISGASVIPPGEVMNIIVTNPTQGQSVGLPLVVQGRARVFENTVNLRVKDANGKILIEDVVTADSPDIGQYGQFEKSLYFVAPTINRGFLEVYTISAKDGSEIEKVIISINFATVDSITVKAFFSNSQRDPNALSCGTTYAVNRRVPRTTAVGQVALEQLLAGTTVTDQKQGFFSNINPGTTLRSLSISNGVARADFNEMLGFQVGGSCRVAAIRSQIESTLKQFTTVQSVVVTINGQSTEVLQP
ncbi:MAG: hypothetical protein US81_C0031G0003 [Parcubacteria group bacterium GW2011_GWE2_38_18]|nr:MAG: hypothetical protein US81_C0031G0003 [Parcubacteria group bacterium GW2011_GWE2_38_18]